MADYPEREIHVILDNLSTHKPKRDLWLARHPNVHLHYTPTHTSWLNQIEIRFSILSGKSLDDSSFQTVHQLKTHIDAFIESYNEQVARSSGQRARSTRSVLNRVSLIDDFWVLDGITLHLWAA